MSKSISLSRLLLVTTLVGMGIAAFWLMAVNWVEQTAESVFEDRQPFENIYTTITGEPVLVRTSSGNTQDTEKILSLAGDPLELTSQDLLHMNGIDAQKKSRLAVGTPEWQMRIASTNDGGVPPSYWYLVHDGNHPGHVYGIGFHASTRTVSGYFGRRGFTDTMPPRDDWFEMTAARGMYGLTTLWGFGQEPRHMFGKAQFLLLADGKLWKIDVGKKQVSQMLDCPQAFQLGQVYRILGQRPAANSEAANYPASSITPMDGIVREPESLIVVNQQSGEQKRFSIPAAMRDKMVSVALLPSGQLLVAAQRALGSSDQQVVWLESSGEIAKQQIVRLKLRSYELSWAWLGWKNALAMPLCIGHVAYCLVWAPETAIEWNEADNFGQALAFVLSKTWLSILAVIVLGVVCAIVTYRRQRRYGLPNAGAWAAFAFLLGPAGWIAYRFHRGWPVLEECPACHQPSPRDREACLDCGAVFPQPAMKGIEVFA